MRFGYFLLLSLALVGCFRESDKPAIPKPSSGTVLVLNEGTFQWGNATVSSYNLNTGEANDGDLFSSANGRPLGDVLQSALLVDGHYWLVVNNSDKIEIVDQHSFQSIKTINQLGSPRHLCKIGPTELALSDLYSDSLSFLNTQNGQITAKTYLEGWAEEMLVSGNSLWVSNPNSHKIYEVSLATKQLTDSIDIGFGSFSVYEDNAKHIWIATRGNKDLSIPSMIHCLDPITKTLLFSENIGSEIVQDFFVDEEDRVYFIHENRVYRFDANSPSISTTLFFDGSGGNLYALEYHAGKVFVTDAIDFTQRGKVFVLDDSGKILDEFQAGRIPNGFLFVP